VIDFTDVKTLAYSATTFVEAGVNNGSITTTSTITLSNDTFTGTDGGALGAVSNVPTGLTAVLVKASATTATLSFTGNAAAHAHANDISNLTVTFGNGDFTGGSAAAVTNATKADLVIDFTDVKTLAYSATTFVEAGVNNGSITTTSTITLSNDTFTGNNGDARGVVSNVPTGLTAVLVRASATTATLSFTGNAAAHANANDISNLTVTFGNGDFTGGSAAAVTNATKADLVMDFTENAPAVTFTASVAADASGTITATLGSALGTAGTFGLYTSADGTTLYTETTLPASGSIAITDTASITKNVHAALFSSAFAIVKDSAGNIVGEAQSVIFGSTAAETMGGTASSDIIFGFAGADTINAGDGNDLIIAGDAGLKTINAGGGNDTIKGSAVVDTITGGDGIDTMSGYAGADVFNQIGAIDVDTTLGTVTDIITDFKVTGADTIRGAWGAGAGAFAKASASVVDLATLLAAADTALDGATKYYLGQVTGGNAYLVTDDDGIGYTEVIQLTGVLLATVAVADIVA